MEVNIEKNSPDKSVFKISARKNTDSSDNQWTPGRIIDLEYALNQEMMCEDEALLAERDRKIYLNHILEPEQRQENNNPDLLHRAGLNASFRRRLMSVWLANLSEKSWPDSKIPGDFSDGSFFSAKDELTPGNLYEELMSVLRIILVTSGIFTGLALCVSFFSYTGQQPLNISYFLAFILFPQLALILFFILFSLVLKMKLISQSAFVPYPFLYTAVEKLFMFMNRSLLQRISHDQKQAFLSAIGIIRNGQKVYGLVFFWPLFMAMQLFGVAFNCSVICYMLFKVLFFDTAFGWQSTLQFGPDVVHKIVTLVATPWSWIEPSGFAVPSLEQIMGSRMVLKDGIYSLATENLVSWWPFLCMAVAVYGLLPRIIFFISGWFAQKRSLKTISFDHASCSRVIGRMLTPEKKSSSSPFYKTNFSEINDGISDDAISYAIKNEKPGSGNIGFSNEEDMDDENNNLHLQNESEELHIQNKNEKLSFNRVNENQLVNRVNEKLPSHPSFILLIPEEINYLKDNASFIKNVESRFLCRILKTVQAGMDLYIALDEIEKAAFDYVNCRTKNSENRTEKEPGVIFLQEAWQPPIKETMLFLKRLRGVLGKKKPLVLSLVGKPQNQTNFAPVGETDWRIWKMKASNLNDPWLFMEKM
ncbi:conserved membrane hypothetical protein [Desulfamplus magnetovallimortis]|uniref:DUF2868 domain-containing protein n=1 Tax=Desulfamplus magnetovallimortis TaxID=1246637 RepID=A0A1W1H7X2_9BACT|nr:DUF2868 domain-containing protein [Desulfamplus magnetovallimortis]SLM28572.1 conserved membrane hypothetical protein [Desulfamplus magnetovallimortis]